MRKFFYRLFTAHALKSSFRQAIKEFPYQESQLFKMLVTNFSQNGRRYGEGASAAEYINQAFNGQRGFRDVPDCDSCGDENAAATPRP